MLQALLEMMKSRLVPPAIAGPPKGPAALRVSAIRQGVMGTKRRAWLAAIVVQSAASALPDPPPDTCTLFTRGEPAFAATFTVTMIGEELAPAASVSLRVQLLTA